MESFPDQVVAKDIWINQASSIHLAAKFMPHGLALLLSSLDIGNILEIKTRYFLTPLHVAAKNENSLSTRYDNYWEYIF